MRSARWHLFRFYNKIAATSLYRQKPCGGLFVLRSTTFHPFPALCVSRPVPVVLVPLCSSPDIWSLQQYPLSLSGFPLCYILISYYRLRGKSTKIGWYKSIFQSKKIRFTPMSGRRKKCMKKKFSPLTFET